MSEHRKFKNEGENSQYNQFEDLELGVIILPPTAIFSHAKVCNVDNNGGDIIQPSLLNISHGMVNMEELWCIIKWVNP